MNTICSGDTFIYSTNNLKLNVSYLGYSLGDGYAFEVQAKKPYIIYLTKTTILKLKKI
jgi:hypothetical protein